MRQVVANWRLAPAAVVLLLIPWVEAGGRTILGLWLDLLLYVVAGAAIAVWLAGRRWAVSAGGLCLLPFVAWVGLSMLWAPYRFAAWLRFFGVLQALLLALAVAALLAAAGAGARRYLSAVWLVAVLPAAGLALWQWASGSRGAAGFVNPNHLGAFLAASLPLTLVASLVTTRPSLVGHARRFLPVLVVAGVIASGSRSALLALGLLGVAAVAGLLYRRLPARPAALAVALFLLLGSVVLGWRFADGTDVYRHDRLRIWPQAVAMAAQEPWRGIGAGQFPHQTAAFNFARDESTVRFGRVFRSPHSHPLLVLAETGIAGATLLLGGLVAALLLSRRRWAAAGAGDAAAPSDASSPAAGTAAAAPDLAATPMLGGLPATALAAACGLGVLAIVSLFDEPLARPPLLVSAALLAAMALPPVRHSGYCRPRIAAAFALTWLGAGIAAGAVLPDLSQATASAAAAQSHPGRHADGLQQAARLNRWQAHYPGEEAALLLSYAARPLDVFSYGRIRFLADRAIDLAPTEPSFFMTRARLQRRACVELFRDRGSCAATSRDYARAAELAPTDARILREAAAFTTLHRRFSASRVLLEQAVDLEPAYVGAWSDLIGVLEHLGDAGERRRAAAGLRQARLLAAAMLPDSPYSREILAPVPVSESARAVAGNGGP